MLQVRLAAALALAAASAGAGPVPRVVDPPAAAGAAAPALAAGGGGALATWLEAGAEGGYRLRFARFDGERWSAPATVIQSPRLLVNWADTPGVAAARDGTLTAWWLERSESAAHASSVALARSLDGGASWRALGALPDDDSAVEHGFVSMTPEGDALRAFWLDGRRTAAGGPTELRTALVAATVAPSERVDERVCDCCATAALTWGGAAVVAYRDRTDDEIRDLAVARWQGGRALPASVAADGWRIAGCPVNGPALAATDEGVAVAWFSAASGRARVAVAFSAGSVSSFGRAQELDGDRPLGRVGIAPLGRGDVAVVWLATRGEEAAVRVRRARPDGALGPALELGTTSASRLAGVPRIAPLPGGSVLVVWLDARVAPARLRGVELDAAALR